MAYTVDPHYISRVMASAMGAFLPVKHSASTSRGGVPAASLNDLVIGFTRATVGTYGLAEPVQTGGVVKAVAAASLGPGAIVGIGSSNGRLIPLAASGVASGAPAAAAPRYRVGVAEDGAADGDIFPVLLDIAQII